MDPPDRDHRNLDDRFVRELQRAELAIRIHRNAGIEATRLIREGRAPDPGGWEDWDTAIPHLDAAVRELDGAFRALRIEPLAVPPLPDPDDLLEELRRLDDP